MKIENWCGHDIRFVEINGEWWAILKDICDALKLRTAKIAERLDPSMLERVLVEESDSRSFEPMLNGSDMGLNGTGSNNLSKVDRSNRSSNDLRSDSRSFEGTLNAHKPVKAIDRDLIGRDIGRKRGEWKTHWMLAVNEIGIYEALFASRRLEARKFRLWAGSVMQRLRRHVGLEGYEVMRMTEPEIQDEIDHILDTLFYDEETGMLMQSVTVQGGDVEQVPFEM